MIFKTIIYLMLLLVCPLEASAQKVALVIGNAKYEHTQPLNNSLNDARGITASLTRMGFTVIPLEDADKGAMEQQLRDFRRQSQGAELALLYYAGHAVQIDGSNYLVPVDAEIGDLRDINLNLLYLNTALQQMGGKINLAILDACRDNPFAEDLKRSAVRLGRSIETPRGLALVGTLSGGSYLMMAAEPGRSADDGPPGGNSPYTTALLEHLETPNLDVRRLAARVRMTVEKQTNQRQRPEAIDRLPDQDIFLAGSGVITMPPAVQPAVVPSSTPDTEPSASSAKAQAKYTKLGYQGIELPDDATQAQGWLMTRDNETALVWEIKTPENKDQQYTWNDAQRVFTTRLNKQMFGGFNDWKLPGRYELQTLIKEGERPTIDTYFFPHTVSSWYWSATSSYPTSKDAAWRVSFDGDLVSRKDKAYNYYVRAVRTGR